ncbi:hypothetical protein F511_15219 [Dorcoceras hygrometricum]|uniref:Uncharacterized protein n=1 Tax=Dorcoceras hygrometricum TaxID=472368 RepID=A0A2Z7CAS3_9LAMI|nr:hypothetical protein F511_15219 [Dorcoceras hygrometricum]
MTSSLIANAFQVNFDSVLTFPEEGVGGVSNSRGPQPPEYRSRPGSGGGSRSESSRKRGGGYRGGGSTSSRGFRYWLGE